MIRKIMHRPQAVLGLAMMLLVFLVMLLAPVFAPNDPMQLNVAHSFAPPDAQYPLGTDELGRCILSRLIYGARASLSIALPTLLLLAVISTVVATLCAYVGGALDRMFEVVPQPDGTARLRCLDAPDAGELVPVPGEGK